MKKISFIVLILTLALCVIGCSGGTNEKTPETTLPEIREPGPGNGAYFTMSLDSSGWDIYTPQASTGYAYRYGPSIIQNEDGSVEPLLKKKDEGKH